MLVRGPAWSPDESPKSEVNPYVYFSVFPVYYHPATCHGLTPGLSRKELINGKTYGKCEGGVWDECLSPVFTE